MFNPSTASTKVKAAVLFQLFVLMLTAILAIHKKNHLEVIELNNSEFVSDYDSYRDGRFIFDENIVPAAEGSGNVDVLAYNGISLKSGSYTLYIDYICNDDEPFKLQLIDDVNTLNGANNALHGTDGYLRYNSEHEMFKFNTDIDVNDLILSFQYVPGSRLEVFRVSISSNNESIKRTFMIFLALFLGTDIIYLLCISRSPGKRQEFINTVLCILGITVLASLPLFMTGIVSGYDTLFHLNRFEAIYNDLKRGAFPVRIDSFMLRDKGYPFSIFYGDIFMYPAGALRMLGFSMTDAWKFYVFSFNLLTVIISYLCFKSIFHKRITALILCGLYATAPYRLTDIYVRSAVGEFTALTFYPIIALAIYRIYTYRLTSEKIRTTSSLLSIGMSCIICTHILSTEIVTLGLLVLVLINWRKTFTKEVITVFIFAIIKTFLISAYFLIPFLDYYISVPTYISSNVINQSSMIQASGLSVWDFFVLPLSPSETYNPGIFLTFTLIAGLVLWINRKADHYITTTIILALFFMILASRYFPWNNLIIRSKAVHILSQIQFPSRYIGPVIILLTMMLGFLLRKRANPYILYILIAAVIMNGVLYAHLCDIFHFITPQNTCELVEPGLVAGEYLRVGTRDGYFTHTWEREGIIQLRSEEGDGRINSLQLMGTGLKMNCTPEDQDTEVTLPKYNYKGYHVFNEKGLEYEIHDGVNNYISFTVPADYAGELYVKFIEPWYWRLSEIISAASIIGLIVVSIRRRNSYRHRLRPKESF